MGIAQSLTAIVLGLAAPAVHTSDGPALQTVASACAGATSTGGGTHAQLQAMYCGVNVVRRAYRVGVVRGNGPLNRSSVMKANAVRRCGFSHTPCGMSFMSTFRRAGYLPARALGENLAWGQAELGTPLETLAGWLDSPPHRANLLSPRWRDLGIAVQQGHMFGLDDVSLWVMEFGRR
jgi:uncharacterized protein YkwD